jgi:hypothetical protein
MAEDNLYGKLGNVSDASTGYYDALANAQVSGCNSSVMAVSAPAPGRQAGRPTNGHVGQVPAAAQRPGCSLGPPAWAGSSKCGSSVASTPAVHAAHTHAQQTCEAGTPHGRHVSTQPRPRPPPWCSTASLQPRRSQPARPPEPCRPPCAAPQAISTKVSPAAFGFDASTCTGASSSVSGTYYKLTSQFPGEGPCYPAWVETKEVYHRWGAKVV